MVVSFFHAEKKKIGRPGNLIHQAIESAVIYCANALRSETRSNSMSSTIHTENIGAPPKLLSIQIYLK